MWESSTESSMYNGFMLIAGILITGVIRVPSVPDRDEEIPHISCLPILWAETVGPLSNISFSDSLWDHCHS